MDDNKYSKVMSEYLVECLLWNELACTRKTDTEVAQMAGDLYTHWDTITHYHKGVIQKDKLLTDPNGSYIKFPSIVRSIACQVARKLPNNPMANRSLDFINNYVVERMKEEKLAHV